MGKKKIVFVFFICLLTLLLSGCYTSRDYPAFRKLTTQCIDKDEDQLLELFDMYEKNVITGIAQIDNTDNTDNGIVVDYNGKKYYVLTPEGKNANPYKKEYLWACDIIYHFMSEYPINEIRYYSGIRCMEIWFKEDFFNIDWGITYYPPGIIPPNEIPDKEQSEEIRDGFYTYLWFKGF